MWHPGAYRQPRMSGPGPYHCPPAPRPSAPPSGVYSNFGRQFSRPPPQVARGRPHIPFHRCPPPPPHFANPHPMSRGRPPQPQGPPIPPQWRQQPDPGFGRSRPPPPQVPQRNRFCDFSPRPDHDVEMLDDTTSGSTRLTTRPRPNFPNPSSMGCLPPCDGVPPQQRMLIEDANPLPVHEFVTPEDEDSDLECEVDEDENEDDEISSSSSSPSKPTPKEADFLDELLVGNRDEEDDLPIRRPVPEFVESVDPTLDFSGSWLEDADFQDPMVTFPRGRKRKRHVFEGLRKVEDLEEEDGGSADKDAAAELGIAMGIGPKGLGTPYSAHCDARSLSAKRRRLWCFRRDGCRVQVSIVPDPMKRVELYDRVYEKTNAILSMLPIGLKWKLGELLSVHESVLVVFLERATARLLSFWLHHEEAAFILSPDRLKPFEDRNRLTLFEAWVCFFIVIGEEEGEEEDDAMDDSEDHAFHPPRGRAEGFFTPCPLTGQYRYSQYTHVSPQDCRAIVPLPRPRSHDEVFMSRRGHIHPSCLSDLIVWRAFVKQLVDLKRRFDVWTYSLVAREVSAGNVMLDDGEEDRIRFDVDSGSFCKLDQRNETGMLHTSNDVQFEDLDEPNRKKGEGERDSDECVMQVDDDDFSSSQAAARPPYPPSRPPPTFPIDIAIRAMFHGLKRKRPSDVQGEFPQTEFYDNLDFRPSLKRRKLQGHPFNARVPRRRGRRRRTGRPKLFIWPASATQKFDMEYRSRPSDFGQRGSSDRDGSDGF